MHQEGCDAGVPMPAWFQMVPQSQTCSPSSSLCNIPSSSTNSWLFGAPVPPRSNTHRLLHTKKTHTPSLNSRVSWTWAEMGSHQPLTKAASHTKNMASLLAVLLTLRLSLHVEIQESTVASWKHQVTATLDTTLTLSRFSVCGRSCVKPHLFLGDNRIL